jgi:hypothetical protein
MTAIAVRLRINALLEVVKVRRNLMAQHVTTAIRQRSTTSVKGERVMEV